MGKLVAVSRSRRVRIAANVFSALIALVVGALMVHHFRASGWPLHHANVPLVATAAVLFLLAYAFKAYGWQRLFARHERPRPLALAAAGGAAAVTGIALPGRFDEVVRIAVVRRFPGRGAGLGAVCLSLFLLGLVDSAALTPLAGVAAAVSASSTVFRVGLGIVAGAGIAAAAAVFLLPRIVGMRRLGRFRLARWLQEHSTCPREASKAWAFVSVSWVLRGAALFVLLHALEMHATVPLVLAFLCASAASAALPVAPAGAATQAGAGAAILAASGVGASEAIAFAVAAQALVILTGAAIVVCAGLWQARLRFAPARA